MDLDADQADRIIRARCGDEIADQVIPVSIFMLVWDVIAAMQDRVDEIAAMASGSLVDARDGEPSSEHADRERRQRRVA
jgi:hypothetical protein